MLPVFRWLEGDGFSPVPSSRLLVCFLLFVVHRALRTLLSHIPYPDARLAHSYLPLMVSLVDITLELSVLAPALHFPCRYIIDSVTSHIMAYY